MVATDVLVPGRAHAIGPEGDLVLSDSSVARVHTAAEYFHDNSAHFERQGGCIDFEGGWAEAAAGMARPPEELREGRLMSSLAAELGVPERFRVAGIESRTTMDNCLQARRYFAGVGRLAIVTQLSQAARLVYCAGKAFPDTRLTLIIAPGEDDPAIYSEEERLLEKSRLLYGWARGPRTLHMADRIGVLAGRLAGLRPAEKYGTSAG